jgi:hypothetical protein
MLVNTFEYFNRITPNPIDNEKAIEYFTDDNVLIDSGWFMTLSTKNGVFSRGFGVLSPKKEKKFKVINNLI